MGGDGVPVERKRMLTSDEYRSILKMADPKRYIVNQERTYFTIGSRSFCISRYNSPKRVKGLCLLYVKGSGDDAMPAFLDIEKKVEGDDEEKYSARNISLKR